MLAKKEALQKSHIALANQKAGKGSSIDGTMKADYSAGGQGGYDGITDVTK